MQFGRLTWSCCVCPRPRCYQSTVPSQLCKQRHCCVLLRYAPWLIRRKSRPPSHPPRCFIQCLSAKENTKWNWKHGHLEFELDFLQELRCSHILLWWDLVLLREIPLLPVLRWLSSWWQAMTGLEPLHHWSYRRSSQGLFACLSGWSETHSTVLSHSEINFTPHLIPLWSAWA